MRLAKPECRSLHTPIDRDEGAAAAVRAGVKTIEHGTFLSDDTLRLMRERDVCFTPTLSGSATDVIPMSESPAAVALAIRSRAMLPRAQESVRHGVKVIAGADTGYSPDDPHRLSDEMSELSRTGMPLIEVIRAATSRAAECIGISKRTGAIRVGLEADVIVLDRNPLEDIDAVRDVLLVINDGKIAVNHFAVLKTCDEIWIATDAIARLFRMTQFKALYAGFANDWPGQCPLIRQGQCQVTTPGPAGLLTACYLF